MALLARIAPVTFGPTRRVCSIVQHIMASLGMPDGWKVELAASLGALGYSRLAQDVLVRSSGGTRLDRDDAAALLQVAGHAFTVVDGMPGMSDIAAMLDDVAERSGAPDSIVVLGRAVLRLARGVEQRLEQGERLQAALGAMKRAASPEDGALLLLLDDFKLADEIAVVRSLRIAQMTGEMWLDEDVRTTAGVIVVPRGHPLSTVVLTRLLRLSHTRSLVEPVRVRVPS